MLQADPGTLDLAITGLAPKLANQLGALCQARRTRRTRLLAILQLRVHVDALLQDPQDQITALGRQVDDQMIRMGMDTNGWLEFVAFPRERRGVRAYA